MKNINTNHKIFTLSNLSKKKKNSHCQEIRAGTSNKDVENENPVKKPGPW
jgi:hypothetical protein